MTLATFNWADYAIIAILLVSVVISLVRGLVKEALSLVSWFAAFWISFHYVRPLAELLTGLINNSGLRLLAAFFILFAITLIIGTLINYLISQVVQKTGLSGTDRMLGMIFGFGRGVLVISLFILVAGLSHIPEDKWWKVSMLIPHFKPVATWLQVFLPDKLQFHYG